MITPRGGNPRALTKKRAEAAAHHGAARAIADHIPMGQPVLVGHHSERRHRRDLERIDRSRRKSMEADKAAAHYEHKAATYGTHGVSSDDPDATGALEQKLAELEARRDEYKVHNRTTRAAGGEPLPAYVLKNLGANIRRYRKRIQELTDAVRDATASRGERPRRAVLRITFRTRGPGTRGCCRESVSPLDAGDCATPHTISARRAEPSKGLGAVNGTIAASEPMRSLIACVCVLTAACGSEVPEEDCGPVEAVAIDPAGMHVGYVVDSIDVGGTYNEAIGLGFDLDENGDIDPALGAVLGTLFTMASVDPDEQMLPFIEGGAILHMFDLQTVSLEAAQGVGLTLLHGVDTDGDPSDNFSGSELFDVDEARGRGLVTGSLTNGTLTVSYGSLPVAVIFPGVEEPVVLELSGGRVEATLVDGRMVGRLGGAVTTEEMDERVMPLLAVGAQWFVDQDCMDGMCEPSSRGERFLKALDTDGDGSISADELRQSALVQALLAPDTDLFDRDGQLAPGCDEVQESLGFAVGFTAVGARFPGVEPPPTPGP